MVRVAVFYNEKDALFGQAEQMVVASGDTLDLSTYYQDSRDIYLRVSEFNGPDTVAVNGITYSGPTEITLIGKIVDGTLYDSGVFAYGNASADHPAAVLKVNTQAIGPDLNETIIINFGTVDADVRVTEDGDTRVTDNGDRRVVWEF